MKSQDKICYLCLKPILLKSEFSADHVPPLQIFPEDVRKKFNLSKLTTLPAHYSCQKIYQKDEDYFVTTFSAFAAGTDIGALLWKTVSRNLRRPNQTKLREMILGEFSEKSPVGIYAP